MPMYYLRLHCLTRGANRLKHMETVSRTVRFKKDEADLIDRFLQSNPFFDFSSLTRIAMMQFIQDPRLPLNAVKPPQGADKFKTMDQKGLS